MGVGMRTRMVVALEALQSGDLTALEVAEKVWPCWAGYMRSESSRRQAGTALLVNLARAGFVRKTPGKTWTLTDLGRLHLAELVYCQTCKDTARLEGLPCPDCPEGRQLAQEQRKQSRREALQERAKHG